MTLSLALQYAVEDAVGNRKAMGVKRDDHFEYRVLTYNGYIELQSKSKYDYMWVPRLVVELNNAGWIDPEIEWWPA